MDTETLARLQFALTIMFHYIFPPLSIGIGLALVIMEGHFIRTGDLLYQQMARFWTRIFALTFAIGVATGIVMEFEFGTNWATYSRYVGDVFGSALAAEGVFAFFLESGFLALLLFGWNRVSRGLHYFATIMVCLGAHFSAVWIVVANSWMQTPSGYHIVGDGFQARAEIVDFWAMVFNPSSMTRLAHVIFGAWLAGAFLICSISAYYLLRQKHTEFAKRSLNVGLAIATVGTLLQAVTGHASAQLVAEHQPAKLAAMEGIFRTEAQTPIYLMGVPDTENQTVRYGIAIPRLLSFLVYGDFSTPVSGLDQIPKDEHPPVGITFQTYHAMIFVWSLMVLTVALAWIRKRQEKLYTSRGTLRVLVLSAALPQIANQAGWVSAEVGRYPWIVYKLLRVPDALSKVVTESQILASLFMFGFIYLLLGALFIYILDQKIKHGPDEKDLTPAYHHLKDVMRGSK